MVTTVPVIIDPRRHDAVVLVPAAQTMSPDSLVALARQLRRAGVGTAVVSSRDGAETPYAAGPPEMFDVCVDGPPGNTDPAQLVEAAARAGARAGRCAVLADTADGVSAGREGGFALVIGVDPAGDDPGQQLRGYGADMVVADPHEVTVRTGDRRMSALPDARAALDRSEEMSTDEAVAVFFDFDGTLSEIVDDPDSAQLVTGAGEALTRLAARCPVAVLSGRDLADVRERVGVPGIWYAGSHGFELTGPDGAHHENEDAGAAVPVLADAAAALRTEFDAIAGVVVEHKRFAVAVHYRNAARERVGELAAAVRTAGAHRSLRVTTGREVIELRPDVDWDKGRTLRWILDHIAGRDVGAAAPVPIYLGDDITDEDAFDALGRDGVPIVVRHTDDGDRPTAARFALDDPVRVGEFTGWLAERIGGDHR